MCNPVAMGIASGAQSALGAIGAAQEKRAENERRKRDYEYKLAIRKNRWMRTLSIYGTKKVQFEKSIDESNIAAQRAYTQSQINYNRVRTQALLDQQTDFKEMLKSEGMIEARAAERGVRGSNVARSLNFNLQTMGLANRQRSRALTETQYRFQEANEATRRKARSDQNKLFSQVAIQPTPDLAPPAPVMQNTSFGLMTGLLGAALDGFSTYSQYKANNPFAKSPTGGGDSGGDGGGGSKQNSFYNSSYTPVGYDYTGGGINYYV